VRSAATEAVRHGESWASVNHAMKHPRLRASGFFVIRSPLLSFQTFRNEASASLVERVAELQVLCKSGPIADALYASSPSLAAAMQTNAMLEADIEVFEASEPQRRRDPLALAAACMRYVERMRGRATPFGLCAGYSMGLTGKLTTPLTLTALGDYDRVLRIDLDVINSAVRTSLVDDLEARRKGRFRTTSDLIFFHDTLKAARRALDGTVSYADITKTDAIVQPRAKRCSLRAPSSSAFPCSRET
jgi:lantibiotic biosynthesis protein